jgi:hypothetical protein
MSSINVIIFHKFVINYMRISNIKAKNNCVNMLIR